MAIEARQFYGSGSICYDQYGRAYSCRSSWNSWGRWVALGVIVIAFFFFFFLCSCFSARRRRKAGRQPFYGTGWAGRTGHGQAQYNPQYETQQPTTQQNYQSPPNYQQTTGTTGTAGGYYGENAGYYGGRQTDVEMQPPSQAYGGGYAPPPGPPPGKL